MLLADDFRAWESLSYTWAFQCAVSVWRTDCLARKQG